MITHPHYTIAQYFINSLKSLKIPKKKLQHTAQKLKFTEARNLNWREEPRDFLCGQLLDGSKASRGGKTLIAVEGREFMNPYIYTY